MKETTQSSTTEAKNTSCSSVPESVMTAGRCELTDVKLHISGKLPDDLQGHVFIVGPVGDVNSGGLPYPNGDSVLNGDGMIYRLDFDCQGEVGLRSRIVKPPCYFADKATRLGSMYAKYRFRNHGLLRFSLSLGARNDLNTAFLPIRFRDDSEERLLVTYDAGRPYEIDTQTLEVVTPVGANLEWRAETQLKFPFQPVFSTAHPAFDAHTNRMFTVNYGRSAGNFLETIPFIYGLDKLPHEIDELLDLVGEFIETQDLIKDFIKIFSQFSQNIWQLYIRIIEQITSIDIEDFVYLVCWDGVGNLERWKLILPDGSPVRIEQTMHQIGVTQDYVVLMDTAFKTGLEQIINNPFPENKGVEKCLRNILTRPVSPDSTIYIVRRADLKVGQCPASAHQEVEVIVRRVVIPLEAAHFLVNYENPHGHITLHASHICAWDVAEWLRDYHNSAYKPYNPVPSRLNGMEQDEMDISRMGRYVIDGESGQLLKSQVISDLDFTWGVGLYAYPDRLSSGMPPGQIKDIYWTSFGLWKELLTKFICDLYKDYKYRAVPVSEVLRLAEQGVPASLFRLHTSDESLYIADSFQFPEGYMVSSPQFVPCLDGNDGSTDGYIVCTVAFDDSNEIWVFDANNLNAGAVCKLSHPLLKFGYTLHTAWLPSIGLRTANYYISVRQDYKDLVKQQSQEIQQMFENEVYRHFA